MPRTARAIRATDPRLPPSPPARRTPSRLPPHRRPRNPTSKMRGAALCCAILIASSLHAETNAVPGLRKPVEILRDRWGVPHIYAQTVEDLFFAQGYITARDRLFQIDLWRRIGTGKLAEAMGPAAIDRDKLARSVRWRARWSRSGL